MTTRMIIKMIKAMMTVGKVGDDEFDDKLVTWPGGIAFRSSRLGEMLRILLRPW